MNPEELQKSIQILEKAEHIALVLPAETSPDILASAEVLTQTLTQKGKRVGFLIKPDTGAAIHPESYTSLHSPELLLKEFIISMETSNSPISQLRYEHENNRVDIILSPKTKLLAAESVSFREGKTLCDCVIALGIPDIEIFGSSHGYESSLFTDTPIINLDTHPKNTHYGETNIVLPEKSSLSELVYEYLVDVYKEPLPAEQATLLLSGIIYETDHFKSPAANADTLLAASELTRLGAKHHDAFSLAKSQEPLGLIQLFGRASVRSRIDHECKIVWSFLTAEDFAKTSRSPADIPQVLTRLKGEFAAEKLCILLWQEDGKEVSGIATGIKHFLDALYSRTGGELDKTTLKIGGTYPAFKDAEEHLSELLKAIL